LWKIWPRREATAEGRNCVNHMKVSVHFSYMYTGCNGNTYVRAVGCSGHNRESVCGLQWAQSCMYVGCSKVNRVHPYKFSGQEQVCTG
jgi:hypothetical protein